MSRIPGVMLGVVVGGPTAPTATVLEVFVDFMCPFSKRISERLVKEVKPHYGEKLKLVFHPMAQPWHPQGCAVHECFHVAAAVDPSKQEAIYVATMDFANPTFCDVPAYDKTRRDIHEAFADVYESKCSLDKAAFLEGATIKQLPDGSINSGNAGTRMLKIYTKMHRQLGVHVS